MNWASRYALSPWAASSSAFVVKVMRPSPISRSRRLRISSRLMRT